MPPELTTHIPVTWGAPRIPNRIIDWRSFSRPAREPARVVTYFTTVGK